MLLSQALVSTDYPKEHCLPSPPKHGMVWGALAFLLLVCQSGWLTDSHDAESKMQSTFYWTNDIVGPEMLWLFPRPGSW